MGRSLAIAAVLWPLALGSAMWARQGSAEPAWSRALYAAASTVCHQRPDRSFFTHGVKWPVCGRCSGLYLAAPIGALAAFSRRRTTRSRVRVRLLVLAAVPTLLTVAIEWFHLLPVTSLVRALSAVPLGAAIAFALVRVTTEGEVH